jgi:hypothetical protein
LDTQDTRKRRKEKSWGKDMKTFRIARTATMTSHESPYTWQGQKQ